jgi:hypothetical protein
VDGTLPISQVAVPAAGDWGGGGGSAGAADVGGIKKKEGSQNTARLLSKLETREEGAWKTTTPTGPRTQAAWDAAEQSRAPRTPAGT